MSLGLVVLEKKLFMRTRMRTRTYMPQSDDIKTGITVDVSAKNAFPTFLFGGSHD